MAIVKVTKALLEKSVQNTDWAKLDAQTDADIARNIAADTDAAPLLTEAETIGAFAKSVRKHLGLSQTEFSAKFHIPLGTLRDWEQNRAQPDSPAIAYLRVIASKSDMVAEVLGI